MLSKGKDDNRIRGASGNHGGGARVPATSELQTYPYPIRSGARIQRRLVPGAAKAFAQNLFRFALLNRRRGSKSFG